MTNDTCRMEILTRILFKSDVFHVILVIIIGVAYSFLLCVIIGSMVKKITLIQDRIYIEQCMEFQKDYNFR